jgi:hypothetical protein
MPGGCQDHKTCERDQLGEAAKTSNAALAKLSPNSSGLNPMSRKTRRLRVSSERRWSHSTARGISVCPATKIPEIKRMINPTTASSFGRVMPTGPFETPLESLTPYITWEPGEPQTSGATELSRRRAMRCARSVAESCQISPILYS